MFGLLRKLLGDSGRGAGNGHGARRSVTADVLAHGVRVPPKTKTQSAAAAGGATDASFDPYNTGKFDRSASWERISRTHR
jgi:hypothetical protein